MKLNLTTDRIGSMIRFHRKKARLSQIELAELGGVGKTVIFDVEKGKMTIKLETLLKIMSVLNITICFQSPLMQEFDGNLKEEDEN